MRRTLRVTLLSVFVACSPPSPQAPDDAIHCECAESYFCCLGECLPLGTVCGAAPDGGGPLDTGPGPDAACGDATVALDAGAEGGDAAVALDAGAAGCDPRPAPQGGTAPVHERCLDAHTVSSCSTGEAQACRSVHPACHEWFDQRAAGWTAGCFDESAEPCVLGVDKPHCEGALLYGECRQSMSYPSQGERLRASDCRELLGATDAVCMFGADGFPRCDSPTIENCTTGYLSSCAADLSGYKVCNGWGNVEVEPCPPDHYCLDNEFTREFYSQVACIPTSAVPSSAPPGVHGGLSCEGTYSIRVEGYGMEWVESCPRVGSIQPDGTYSGVPGECSDAAGFGRAQCVKPGAECAESSFLNFCDAEGKSVTCRQSMLVRADCSPGVCHPLAGVCVPS